jgi:hypothetical protein
MMTGITLTIPAHLVQPLAGLLDAGLRSTGLKGAKAAGELIELIEAAVAAAGTGKENASNGHDLDNARA